MADDCYSCGEEAAGTLGDAPDCPESPRRCGHHCNHSWTHDICHWCRAQWGEGGMIHGPGVDEPIPQPEL